MLNASVPRFALTAFSLLLLTPAAFAAPPQWAIAAGQESLLEKALTPTAAWPRGWTFTGASIDHGVIDARYQDPTGKGLGVRLQHPQGGDPARVAGQFEIANISADLPDSVLAQLKTQLAALAQFEWTPLHDRQGDAATALPAEATDTVQARGDALIAQKKAAELANWLADAKVDDCTTRQHWIGKIADTRDATLFALALDLAKRPPACPHALQSVARWTATLGKPAEGEAILRDAIRVQDDPLLQIDLALLLRQQDRCADSLAVLAKLDLAKVPGIAAQLSRLSRIYIDCPDAPLLAQMTTRADGQPPDAIAAFIVGAILHHEGKWRESDPYLLRAEPLMKDEPREYLYRAMNAFHDGRQAEAEQLVGHAAQMGSTDPDVLYCRANIFGERDIGQAIADLQAYDKAMADTLDKTPGKQQRVAEMLAELQACQGAKDLRQCRNLRKVSQWTVRWLPGIAVVVLGLFALLRWRRRR